MEAIVDHTMTDKNSEHSYVPVYERLFSPFKDTCKNILEVGVYYGGSIKLWTDYFPTANVYGIDLDLSRNRYFPNNTRTHIVQGDAYNPLLISKFDKEAFDVVIDDGWHTLESMCLFTALYNRLVRPGGYLVVEDLKDVRWADEIAKFLPDNMTYSIVDNRHVKNRFDDIMFIAQKKIV